MTLPQAHLLSIGQTISALSQVPELPEENWRRTDPAQFFLPDAEVVNSFGQAVLGSHLASSPYKVQFKVLSVAQMQQSIATLIGAPLNSSSESQESFDEARVVLLNLNNGGIVVSSCACLADTASRSFKIDHNTR